MSLPPDHFIIAARPGLRGVDVPGFGVVQFSRITLAFAGRLWLAGFEYLYILPAGARALFAEATVPERIKLLELCRTPEEVYAIRDIKRTKALDKAAEQRITELVGEARVRGPEALEGPEAPNRSRPEALEGPSAHRVVDTPEPEGSV